MKKLTKDEIKLLIETIESAAANADRRANDLKLNIDSHLYWDEKHVKICALLEALRGILK